MKPTLKRCSLLLMLLAISSSANAFGQLRKIRQIEKEHPECKFDSLTKSFAYMPHITAALATATLGIGIVDYILFKKKHPKLGVSSWLTNTLIPQKRIKREKRAKANGFSRFLLRTALLTTSYSALFAITFGFIVKDEIERTKVSINRCKIETEKNHLQAKSTLQDFIREEESSRTILPAENNTPPKFPQAPPSTAEIPGARGFVLRDYVTPDKTMWDSLVQSSKNAHFVREARKSMNLSSCWYTHQSGAIIKNGATRHIIAYNPQSANWTWKPGANSLEMVLTQPMKEQLPQGMQHIMLNNEQWSKARASKQELTELLMNSREAPGSDPTPGCWSGKSKYYKHEIILPVIRNSQRFHLHTWFDPINKNWNHGNFTLTTKDVRKLPSQLRNKMHEIEYAKLNLKGNALLEYQYDQALSQPKKSEEICPICLEGSAERNTDFFFCSQSPNHQTCKDCYTNYLKSQPTRKQKWRCLTCQDCSKYGTSWKPVFPDE